MVPYCPLKILEPPLPPNNFNLRPPIKNPGTATEYCVVYNTTLHRDIGADCLTSMHCEDMYYILHG